MIKAWTFQIGWKCQKWWSLRDFSHLPDISNHANHKALKSLDIPLLLPILWMNMMICFLYGSFFFDIQKTWLLSSYCSMWIMEQKKFCFHISEMEDSTKSFKHALFRKKGKQSEETSVSKLPHVTFFLFLHRPSNLFCTINRYLFLLLHYFPWWFGFVGFSRSCSKCFSWYSSAWFMLFPEYFWNKEEFMSQESPREYKHRVSFQSEVIDGVECLQEKHHWAPLGSTTSLFLKFKSVGQICVIGLLE